MEVLSKLTRGGEVEIPSLPAMALRLLEAVKSDSYEALAKLIRLDPVMTAKVLAVANSPLYSRGNKIESLETAIAVLGTEMLKNIALSFVLVKNFNRNTGTEFDFENFWRRAITAAISAELMAEKVGVNRERAYISALLMDIGIPIMFLCRPEDYLKVFDEKRTKDLSTVEAERKVFGFDHQDVGSEVVKLWKLPEFLRDNIFYHHKVEEAPKELKKEVEILSLADKVAGVYFAFRAFEKYSYIIHHAEKSLNLSSQEAETLVDEVAEQAKKILEIFDLPVKELKSYSQILEEANRELQRLALTSVQLLQKLKEEKARAEALARKLQEANKKLLEMATKDPLTGLYNRRHFQERLSEEMNRIRRYGGYLSIIILDVDFFKRINDTYGHPCGDEVLQKIAKILKENTRNSDIVARYGGEEFVILLPETNLKGATTLAERLRRQVEEEVFKCEDNKLKVTISLGVACLEPESPKDEKRFLSIADKALYYSKHKGRNRVTAVRV